MKRKAKNFEQYIGTAKVGPKGQIVIPKEVRDMFNIEPGDSLMLMADTRRGIAIQQQNVMSKIADAIFSGKGKDYDPDESEENLNDFAQNIKNTIDEEKDD